MEPYEGDILEHALNKGLASAAARYQVPIEQVRAIVDKFASEIDGERDMRCPCELARAEGATMTCFACTGPVGAPSRFIEGCDVYLPPSRLDKRIHPDGLPN